MDVTKNLRRTEPFTFTIRRQQDRPWYSISIVGLIVACGFSR